MLPIEDSHKYKSILCIKKGFFLYAEIYGANFRRWKGTLYQTIFE